MYRFALAESANPGEYVQSGREAGQDALNLQKAVDRGSPNYAQQILSGAENVSLERTAKRNNEALLKTTELEGKIRIDNINTKYKLDRTRQQIEDRKKFAGKVALAGYTLAEAFRKDKEIPKLDYSRLREALIKSGNTSGYDPILKDLETLRKQVEQLQSPTMTMPEQNGEQSLYPVSPQSGGGKQALYPVSGNNPYQNVGYSPGPDMTNPNRYALSQVVQHAEGTRGPDAYRMMFGHSQSNPRLLNDFSRHPNSPYPTPWGTSSEAAGAYQFMNNTWQDITKANPNIRDFSPESQERAFDFLANRRGVDPSAPISNIDQFTDVMTNFSPEWASLPYKGGASYYDQPVKSIQELYEVYQDALKNPPYPPGMI